MKKGLLRVVVGIALSLCILVCIDTRTTVFA